MNSEVHNVGHTPQFGSSVSDHASVMVNDDDSLALTKFKSAQHSREMQIVHVHVVSVMSEYST